MRIDLLERIIDLQETVIYLQENTSINKYTGVIVEIIDDQAKKVEKH